MISLLLPHYPSRCFSILFGIDASALRKQSNINDCIVVCEQQQSIKQLCEMSEKDVWPQQKMNGRSKLSILLTVC